MKYIKSFTEFLAESESFELNEAEKVEKIDSLFKDVEEELKKDTKLNHFSNDLEEYKKLAKKCTDKEKDELVSDLKDTSEKIKKTGTGGTTEIIKKIAAIIAFVSAMSCGPNVHRITGANRDEYKKEKHYKDTHHRPEPGYGW